MTRSTGCLNCSRKGLELVLDLGSTPLANANLQPDKLNDPEPSFPLELMYCPGCGLVQLSEIVPPEVMFSDYLYMSGASTTMVEHFGRLASSHVQRFGLKDTDLVMEIASNDGTLLSAFKAKGVRTLGIEPAQNLVEVAEKKGVESVARFFGRKCATELRTECGPAALICANNVLAHVPDLGGVLEGCRIATEPEGVVSIEVPYLVHLLEGLEYDTIYHEHLCYFSVRALADAFGRAGLAIFDIERLSVHGGSLRILARAGSRHAEVVDRMRQTERKKGLEDLATYRAFAAAVAKNRTDLRRILRELKHKGKRIAAYGAPAKGNTLLNYCGIGTDLVEYTVDRNPFKVGTFTPGMRLPVREVALLLEDRPEITLILPWNIASEIIEQQKDYVEKGGQFLVPIPQPRVVGDR